MTKRAKPVKLMRLTLKPGQTFGEAYGTGGPQIAHDMHDESGKHVGVVVVREHEGGKHLRVEYVGDGQSDLGTNEGQFGGEAMKHVVHGLMQHYPNAETLSGNRQSGALKTKTNPEERERTFDLKKLRGRLKLAARKPKPSLTEHDQLMHTAIVGHMKGEHTPMAVLADKVDEMGRQGGALLRHSYQEYVNGAPRHPHLAYSAWINDHESIHGKDSADGATNVRLHAVHGSDRESGVPVEQYNSLYPYLEITHHPEVESRDGLNYFQHGITIRNKEHLAEVMKMLPPEQHQWVGRHMVALLRTLRENGRSFKLARGTRPSLPSITGYWIDPNGNEHFVENSLMHDTWMRRNNKMDAETAYTKGWHKLNVLNGKGAFAYGTVTPTAAQKDRIGVLAVRHGAPTAEHMVRGQKPTPLKLARVRHEGDGSAQASMGSTNHQKRLDVVREILKESGLTPSTVRAALAHDLKATSPAFSAVIKTAAHPDHLRYTAAWLGLMTGRDRIAVAHPDPNGEDYLHVITHSGPPDHIVEALKRAGVPRFTSERVAEGTRVFVLNPLGKLPVEQVARSVPNARHSSTRVRVYRIGAGSRTDAAGGQSAASDARANYRTVIDDFERAAASQTVGPAE